MAKLTIQFGEQMDDLLEQLAKEKGITKAEVLRRALAIYKYADDETKSGEKRLSITSAKDNKIVKDIVNL